jgi:Ca-activated chloride channel family protein
MSIAPANKIRRAGSARHLISIVVPVVIGGLWLLMSGVRARADQFAKLNNNGNRLAQQGRYNEALEAYQSARIERPDVPGVIYNMGNAYHLKGAFDSAAAEYQNALAPHDNALSAEAQYNLGNTLFRMREYQPAVEAYKQALLKNPSDLDAKHNLELALRYLERKDSTPKKQQKQQNQPDSSQKEQEKQQDQQQKQDSTQNQQGQQPNQQQQPDSSAAGQKPENQQQEQPQQQAPQRLKGMTRQDAERLLDALKNDELKLQRLRAQRIVEEKVVKDW